MYSYMQLEHTVCLRLAFSNAPVRCYYCEIVQSYMLNMKKVTITCGHAVWQHYLAHSFFSKEELRKKLKGLKALNNWNKCLNLVGYPRAFIRTPTYNLKGPAKSKGLCLLLNGYIHNHTLRLVGVNRRLEITASRHVLHKGPQLLWS